MGWGGRRKGSGRKPRGERAGVSHKKKGALSARHAVHVTMRLRSGLPSLRRWREYEVLLGAFRSGCERFGFRLVHYAVLGNHLHLMTEGEDRRGHSRGVQGLAIRIAKRLNRLWGRKGKVFLERFHGRVLRTPREVRAALAYLMHNARRHGYRVAAEGPDPYSSGRWFDGWRGWSVDRPPTLARAKSWLVRHGWRRLGLIETRWRPP
jgi:REP element-mobilizing transposase RayT